jgi:hypothetical protein
MSWCRWNSMNINWFIIPLWYTLLTGNVDDAATLSVQKKRDFAIALSISGDEELQAGTSVYCPKCSVVPYKFLVYILSRQMKAVSFLTAFPLYTSIQSHLNNEAFCEMWIARLKKHVLWNIVILLIEFRDTSLDEFFLCPVLTILRASVAVVVLLAWAWRSSV